MSIDDLMGIYIPPIPHTTEFFFWKYGDGTEAAAAIDHEDEKEIYSKTFDDKTSRKKYQKSIQGKNEKRDLDFEKNKLSIHSGLNFVELPVGHSKDAADKARPHLLRMLEACGQDLEARAQMIQLFSGLLVGYFFPIFGIEIFFPLARLCYVLLPF